MRPIDADKFEVVSGNVPDKYDVDSYLAGNNEILEMIDNAPTIDVISKDVYDQIRWERDVAIAQLEELGLGFGQVKPDVEVVRHGYWIETPPNFPIHGRYFTCSVCGKHDNKNTAIRGHYCWNCGSKMDLEVRSI
jgi:hypothetical protein